MSCSSGIHVVPLRLHISVTHTWSTHTHTHTHTHLLISMIFVEQSNHSNDKSDEDLWCCDCIRIGMFLPCTVITGCLSIFRVEMVRFNSGTWTDYYKNGIGIFKIGIEVSYKINVIHKLIYHLIFLIQKYFLDDDPT